MDVSLETPLGDYVPWESPENILFTKVIQSLLVKRASGSLRTSVMVFLGHFVLLGDVTQLASYSIGDDRVSKKRDQVAVLNSQKQERYSYHNEQQDWRGNQEGLT